MRIPWYICGFVGLLAFGLTYWLGCKDYDFVTPPKNIERFTAGPVVAEPEPEPTGDGDAQPSLADSNDTEGSSSDEAEVNQQEPEQVVESHPSDYLDFEGRSTEAYVALAEKLISERKSEHSLVAWERVLDSSQPSEEVVKRAFDILKLHKPVLKTESSGIAISITLHASTPADLYEKTEKMVRRAAQIIEMGSAYKIAVTPEVSVVAVAKGKPRPAFSVWLSGKHETPRSSFHTSSANEMGLDGKFNVAIFYIVSAYLEERSSLTPIVNLHNEINAEEALAYLITRHSWRQFGLLLYQDQAVEEPEPKQEPVEVIEPGSTEGVEEKPEELTTEKE